MGQIIAVTNQKGGTGKTTSALNISAYLASFGNRILLVDVDPQGNATSGLGLEKGSPTLYEGLLGSCNIEDIIVSFPSLETLSVIKANNDLIGIEVELIGVPKREYKLAQLLSPLKDRFDAIFLDCPPSLSLLTVMSLTSADRVLVPIQAEFYALEGVAQLMNTIQLVKERLNPSLDILGILLTMVDMRTNLAASVMEEVKNFFKDKMFHTHIPRNVRLGEAPSFGQPIFLYDPSSVGARTYYELSLEVAHRLGLKSI